VSSLYTQPPDPVAAFEGIFSFLSCQHQNEVKQGNQDNANAQNLNKSFQDS
jgi:hypothetical protein